MDVKDGHDPNRMIQPSHHIFVLASRSASVSCGNTTVTVVTSQFLQAGAHRLYPQKKVFKSCQSKETCSIALAIDIQLQEEEEEAGEEEGSGGGFQVYTHLFFLPISQSLDQIFKI